MPAVVPPTLIEYLREQARLVQALAVMAEQAKGTRATVPRSSGPLRVPLALGGSVWSAEVEDVRDHRLRLIVDHEALGSFADGEEATIRYQPENSAVLTAAGRIVRCEALSSQRVAIEFNVTCTPANV